MGDRCNMRGWILLPSLDEALQRDAKVVHELLDKLDINHDTIWQPAKSGKLIFEFEAEDVNYAAYNEIHAAASTGLVGMFHNGAGGEYGSGTVILVGGKGYDFIQTQDGHDVLQVSVVLDKLRADETAGILPKGYANRMLEQLAPGTGERDWLQDLHEVFFFDDTAPSTKPKAAMQRRKLLQRLCKECAAKPDRAAVLLKYAGVSSAALVRAVCAVPELAADVLRARPDIKDRLLELAATGVAGREGIARVSGKER